MHFIDIFFFFSSRRRHTRSLCDWSSDVCSSDLGPPPQTINSNLGDMNVSIVSYRWKPLADLPSNHDSLAQDRKSTRLNSSHTVISYAVFCLKKKKKKSEKQHTKPSEQQLYNVEQ